GVFRISNWRGKPKGRVVEIGRRFANWVTLQDVEGRTVSVVSVHIAPLDKNMPDLLRRSIKRLAVLTARLAPAGPVLVGGDFNVHYKSGRYPRDLIDPTGLAPTFDTLGNFFPTGDHHGATIDYVFNRGAETLVADRHYPVELKSDHDAVVAGLSWLGDLESESVSVRSNPAGGAAERRSVLKSIKVGINSVPAGGAIRLVTRRVDLYAVRARLVAAARRGVAVQVSIVGKPLSEVENKLAQQLSETGQASSWVRRCTGSCARTWDAASTPRTLMLTGEEAGSWSVRFDVDRWLTAAVVERTTSVTRSVGENALQEASDLVASLG
uniref:endonuclease/exonuclease/phosphatase family protein n=1 Tax=Nocardioides sp. TaxID=35761 RepID=UPI002B2673D0